MQIQEVMTTQFEMVDSSDSVLDVANKMKMLNVGVLPVKEGDSLIGMVTDRDIVVRGLAESADVEKLTVKETMTPGIVHCSTEDSIENAVKIMKEQQIRRLVVLDSNHAPVGIVSLGDIAAKAHAEKLAGAALEGISQPSQPAR